MLLMFLMHLATGILLTPTIPLERDSTGNTPWYSVEGLQDIANLA